MRVPTRKIVLNDAFSEPDQPVEDYTNGAGEPYYFEMPRSMTEGFINRIALLEFDTTQQDANADLETNPDAGGAPDVEAEDAVVAAEAPAEKAVAKVATEIDRITARRIGRQAARDAVNRTIERASSRRRRRRLYVAEVLTFISGWNFDTDKAVTVGGGKKKREIVKAGEVLPLMVDTPDEEERLAILDVLPDEVLDYMQDVMWGRKQPPKPALSPAAEGFSSGSSEAK